jgi:acyl carrier protein
MQAATRPEIMEILTDIFRDVFDMPSLELHDNMTAADVDNWDSLNHINLIVSVERRFKIRFTTREVTALKNVGNLADLTQRKLGTQS